MSRAPKVIGPLKPATHSKLSILVRLGIFSILLCGGLLWLWEAAPRLGLLNGIALLQIDDVQIHSEWPVTPASVKRWLPALEGKNILYVRPSELISLLEQKPWVESVTIKKEYPNRLTIDVGTKRAQAVSIVRGQAFFIDPRGQIIEKTSPGMMRALDLPVVSIERESDAVRWPIGYAMRCLELFHQKVDAHYSISQLVLGTFPYFKIYLSHPKVEVSLSWENWESQLPILSLLLHSPPNQIGQPQRINLVFPKKAVVSQSLSN